MQILRPPRRPLSASRPAAPRPLSSRRCGRPSTALRPDRASRRCVARSSWLWMRRISARISMRSFVSRFDSGSSIRIERRLDHDRARDRDALLLTARQLPRQLASRDRPVARAAALRARGASASLFATPRIFRPKPTLSSTRHMRKQRVVLEHHAEAALFRRQHVDALVVEPDAAAASAAADRRCN